MNGAGGRLAVLIALVVWSGGSDRQSLAQEPALPPGPYARTASLAAPVAFECQGTLQDRNGPVLQGNPLLDPPPTPPGWFGALELGVIAPHFKNRLIAPVTVGEVTEQVHLPTAELTWTAAPRFEVGYRLPEAVGELLVSYRFLATEGSAVIPSYDALGAGSLKSRLDVNVIDLDYASREFSLGPHWDMKWRVGARVNTVFFDSRAAGAILEQRTSNHFWGVGAHLGLDLWRSLPAVPGLALFFRSEGGPAQLGKLRQRFEETLAAPGSPRLSGETAITKVRESPFVNFQAGVSYLLPQAGGRQLRFAAGYQLERWFYLEQADGFDSRGGELTMQGLFVRVEWGF